MRSKQNDEFGGTVNDVATKQGRTMSQRDPGKEWNQLRPTSLRSSGQELDPACSGGSVAPTPSNPLQDSMDEIFKPL